MMLQQNKIFVCVQLYYGPPMIFLHMQIFQVGVLKGNLLVLFVLHFDYKTDGNGVTWVIVDFCRLIIDFDVIKSPLMEMKSIEQHLNNCLDVLHQLDEMEHITLGKISKNKMSAKRKREHVELEHNWKKKTFFSNCHIGKPSFCVTIWM